MLYLLSEQEATLSLVQIVNDIEDFLDDLRGETH